MFLEIMGGVLVLIVYAGGVQHIGRLMKNEKSVSDKSVVRYFFPLVFAIEGMELLFGLIRKLWDKHGTETLGG